MMRSIKSCGGLTTGRGVTESVCLQWICSMHKCAGIHDAMTTVTKLKHRMSEQHIELGDILLHTWSLGTNYQAVSIFQMCKANIFN